MAKYIHNISGESKTYQGKTLSDGEYYLIPPPLYTEFSEDSDLLSDIMSGDIVMSRDGVADLTTVENSLALLAPMDYRVSVAIDKEGIDQYASGTSAVTITADRILWDLHEDYDLENEAFVVPIDGVYFFDIQLRLTNLSNVSTIELALYKSGSPDDYWFILDKKDVSSLSDIQLSGATSFDFYKGDSYKVKLIMTKVLPLVECSCTIDGDDDFTAWGYSLNYPF